jgi:hypothetical protein
MERFPYCCGFNLSSTKPETVSMSPKFGFYRQGLPENIRLNVMIEGCLFLFVICGRLVYFDFVCVKEVLEPLFRNLSGVRVPIFGGLFRKGDGVIFTLASKGHFWSNVGDKNVGDFVT